MTQRAAQPDQQAAQPDQHRAAQPDQHGSTQPQPGPVYEVRVRGVLEERWSSWFDGLDIVPEPPENSLIVGPVADQCALHGLLAKVRDLGLPLISVRLIEE
jgi:hypothetical protein